MRRLLRDISIALVILFIGLSIARSWLNVTVSYSVLHLLAIASVVAAIMLVSARAVTNAAPGEIRPGWYTQNNSDVVVVFIHGLFSDHENAWRYVDKQSLRSRFWPDMIAADYDGFGAPSIFLVRYFTDLHSGDFGIEEAARETMVLLESRGNSRRSVTDYPRIVFVCHSMGGIVARWILSNYKDKFKGKDIGLFLFASPMGGSTAASMIGPLISFTRNRQASELVAGHPLLKQIKESFFEFMDQAPSRSIKLGGQEFCENFAYDDWWWRVWFRSRKIVDRHDAIVHFPPGQTIPNTNHSTIVRPTDEGHRSHMYLRQTYQELGFRNNDLTDPVH